MLAEKKPPQSCERTHDIPTPRFSDRQQAHAAVAEQFFKRTAGIEDGNRHVMAAPRQPGRQHGELTLAAADGEIADEQQELHGPIKLASALDRKGPWLLR
jgi:hypothetical protein